MGKRKRLTSMVFLAGLLAGLATASAPVNECDDWQSLHPEWIFCDDFESDAPMVGEGRYFEYDDDEGEFIPMEGVGLGGSKGMRALFQAGELGAGNLLLGFGRNPIDYMNNGIRDTEDFREIYYRMYLKMQGGWLNNSNNHKLSRATSFSSTSWAQAMIAHLWSSGDCLLIDPASGVEDGVVVTTKYNDFANLHWLGQLAGVTPIFDSQHDDTWYCIEHHIRLNDPGHSNGVQEFWIDGQLEARRDGLNFVDTWTDYAINAVFFENYWNGGSPQLQERYFDNIVVSTEPIDVPPEPEPEIIYVDADAVGANDGTSWDDAFNYLRSALIAAQSGDEIWVAEGVYNPDQSRRYPNGSGRRNATFSLRNDVAIKGGFAGFGEPDPNERDPNTYETILSGDLNGDDGPDFANNDENSYNVITGSGTNVTAVLDGFTITGGNANGGSDPYDRGGGINSYYGSPTITNCTFRANSAGSGGVMYNNSSSPTITNCTFSGNSAKYGGGVMNNWNNSSPVLTNCTFNNNSAEWGGGGMCNVLGSSAMLSNCTFSGNSAGWDGGGIDNYDNSNPTLTNCIFSGNSATWDGGGMNNGDSSSPTLSNCTFSKNSAETGGGGGMNNRGESSPVLTDCTFNKNLSRTGGGGMCNVWGSSPMLSNCTFSGNSAGWGGGGIDNYDNCNLTLTNCTFSGNSATWDGGGLCNSTNSHPTITNCTFINNTAENYSGGGMFNLSGSRPTITNCTFIGNSAGDGGGGMYNRNDSHPTLTNCILWSNTAPSGSQINNDGTSSAAVSHCDVQGDWPGTGNINADPLFLNASNEDLHLLPTSPCIDAGDNTAVPAGITTDLDGHPRFVDQPEVPDTGNGTAPIVDMGAFEADYIEVAMKFTPKTLNPGSKGKWLKAHFVLPEGFDIEDVDANTPAVIALLGVESEYMNVFINEDGFVEFEAAFSRTDFCGLVTINDTTEVIVIGLLKSGQNFYGTDIIKITDRAFEHLALFVSYWLAGDCSEPDWCGGSDLNADSVVNFLDFALLDGCCIEEVPEQ